MKLTKIAGSILWQLKHEVMLSPSTVGLSTTPYFSLALLSPLMHHEELIAMADSGAFIGQLVILWLGHTV